MDDDHAALVAAVLLAVLLAMAVVAHHGPRHPIPDPSLNPANAVPYNAQEG